MAQVIESQTKPDGGPKTTTATLQTSDDGSEPRNDFPTRPSEVTGEFLSSVLGAKVVSYDIKRLGDGQICDAHKVTITEYSGTPGPSSVVLKMPKDDKASRAVNQGLYQLEAHWYRTIQEHVPLSGAKTHGIFTDETDPTRFLLVLEDLSLDEDVESYPHWMVGVPVPIMEGVFDDLARMHAQFWKSPLLDKIVPHVPDIPGVPLKPNSFRAPYVSFAFGAYAPFPAASLMGFPEGTSAIDVTEGLIKSMKDYLKWDYQFPINDGPTYRVPEGPYPYPDPRLKAPVGPGILIEVARILGSRPKTLLHGDAHPGNIFWNKKTGQRQWIDFQMYSAGPPGMDLASGISLGLQKPSKETVETLVKKYYAKLLEYGPSSIKDEYTFDMLWEDVVLGMVLNYPVYALMHAINLPQLKGDPDEEVKLAGFRSIVPRYFTTVLDVKMLDKVDELLQTVMAEVAVDATSPCSDSCEESA